MKTKIRFIPLLLFFMFSVWFYFFSNPQKTVSASLSSVKNTLSTSQLSYFGRLGVGNSATSTILTIALSGNPSNTTNNLFTDDPIAIGNTNANTLTTYTVKDVGSTATFLINEISGLGSQNAYAGLAVIATRSAIHKVEFTPTSNFPGGSFQVLIKASNQGGIKSYDGIPDQDGFDLGSTTPTSGSTGLGTRLTTADITCPPVGIGGTSLPSISTITEGGNTYHSIVCSLGAGGTNAVGVGYSMTIGRPLASGSQLINPSPSASSTEGTATGNSNVYTFYVRHRDSTNTVIDSTQGKIAVVESVRVTATVDPTLTFIIDDIGTTSGNTVCGNVLGAAANNTTATAVKFGSVSIASFNNLAQRLSCITNASGGYVVTGFESKPLTNISTGTTIVNTSCDSGPCTINLAVGWTTPTNYGFGYSIQNINASTPAFTYGGGTNFIAKPFGVGYANTATLFSNSSTPTTTERIYVCYRLNVSTLQQAGEYENGITYTATATF